MIRTCIADDEAPARKRLLNFLEAYPDIEVVGEGANGEETIDLVERLRPDLLFLDIQMPKGDGFEVLSRLSVHPVTIFTTAFDEYAIKAFDVHAMDYLLKPYSKERFEKSMELVRKTLRDPKSYTSGLLELIHDAKRQNGFIERVSVREKYTYSIVPVNRIMCIRTDGGLVFIHTEDQRYQTDISLSHFEENLDPARFFRVHRTALINLEKIRQVIPWGQGRFAIELENGLRLQVSRDRVQKFKELIGLRI